MQLCATDMSLQFRDDEGQLVTTIGAGQQFVVLLTVTDWPRNMGVKPPTIQGMLDLGGMPAGYRMHTVNGTTQIQFNYRMRIDTPGIYTIGPAEIEFQSQKIIAQPSTIKVLAQSPRQAGQKQKGIWAELSLNKKQVVIGEKIQCTVNLYFDNQNIERAELVEQTTHFTRKNSKNPEQSVKTIQGRKYNCITWQWDIYPQKEGDVIIPAFPIVYQQFVDRATSGWSAFDLMLGQRLEQKTVYSNPATVHVDAVLPNSKEKIPVGVFNKFVATAQPAEAKVGEGIVVALELTGEFDSDAVSINVQGPPACNFYESKTSVIPLDTALSKRFEYIVQGLQEGTISIPSQKFVYFDTTERQCKTLKTKPLKLTILPGVVNNEEKKEVIAVAQDVVINEEYIRPLHTHNWQPEQSVWVLPWWTFFMIMMMPVFGSGTYALIKTIVMRRMHNSKNQKQRALSKARHTLNVAAKKQNVQQLYYLFIQLFKDRNIEDIHILLPSAQLAEWQQFWLTITEIVFTKTDKQNTQYLFEQARLWLDRLEQIV